VNDTAPELLPGDQTVLLFYVAFLCFLLPQGKDPLAAMPESIYYFFLKGAVG